MIRSVSLLNLNTYNKISFKSRGYDDDDAENYAGVDADVAARDLIRRRLEGGFDPTYDRLGQCGSMSVEEMRYKLQCGAHSNIPAKVNARKTDHYLDMSAFSGVLAPSDFLCVRRKNEIVTGARLSLYSDGIKAAHDAGIKTILTLAPIGFGYYDKNIKEAKQLGMELVGIQDIGHGKLKTFAIIPTRTSKAELLTRLIDEPSCWQTRDKNGKILADADRMILDLQEFVDILNGDHPKYKLPVYYGCNYGTSRTSAWHSLFSIISECDRTKPLSPKTVEKLAELYDELEALFKD